jgi:hypothetical protein
MHTCFTHLSAALPHHVGRRGRRGRRQRLATLSEGSMLSHPSQTGTVAGQTSVLKW